MTRTHIPGREIRAQLAAVEGDVWRIRAGIAHGEEPGVLLRLMDLLHARLASIGRELGDDSAPVSCALPRA